MKRPEPKEPQTLLPPLETILLIITALFTVTSLLFYAHQAPAGDFIARIEYTKDPTEAQNREPEPEVDAPGMLPGEVLDLNTATEGDLTRLPGIGPSRAEGIITYRETTGGFQSIEEVQEVYGIGPATFERISPYITVSPQTEETQE